MALAYLATMKKRPSVRDKRLRHAYAWCPISFRRVAETGESWDSVPLIETTTLFLFLHSTWIQSKIEWRNCEYFESPTVVAMCAWKYDEAVGRTRAKYKKKSSRTFNLENTFDPLCVTGFHAKVPIRSSVYVCDNSREVADVINTGRPASRTWTVPPLCTSRDGFPCDTALRYRRWPIFRVYCVPRYRAVRVYSALKSTANRDSSH